MENLYIIPIDNDKPVKIIIENDPIIEYDTERYRKTPKEVLRDELKYNQDLRNQLTRQQIHSEYGKLKSNNCKDVINFLLKRGVTTLRLNQKLNEIHERHTFKTKIAIDTTLIESLFGIYKIEDNEPYSL